MPTASGWRIISAPPTGRRRRPHGGSADIDGLAERIRADIEEAPAYFAELAERYAADGFQAVARALGKLHEDDILWQDAEGRHCLRDSRFAAKPPAARRSGS